MLFFALFQGLLLLGAEPNAPEKDRLKELLEHTKGVDSGAGAWWRREPAFL